MPSGRKKSTADDEMMQCVKQALKDDDVIATMASKIADIVANKINDRLNHLERTLKEKDQRIDQLEKTLGSRIDQLEQSLDNLEQYSRRSSVRVSGIKEKADGEQLDTILADLFTDMDVHLTLNNVNRAHRIGPRTSITNRQHSRQILIQFKDHQSKTTFMKARKHLRGKQPTVFISEDLTQKRSRLLYLCRGKKRKHQLQDCWSYDGRIVTKDSNGRIKTITCEEDLNEL